jgi:hypothetical protein
MVDDKAFSSTLIDAICESLRDTLGPDVLQILVSKGLLDNSDSPQLFHQQLSSIFSNGATVLERVVIKEFYRKLGVPYRPEPSFDYRASLETAKKASLANSANWSKVRK